MESDIDLYVNSLRFEKGLSHHTIAAYASDLAQGLLYFRRAGLASWQQLTEAQFIDFLHQRSKADKPASFARRLVTWRGFLSFLARRQAWAHRPWEVVQSPKLPFRLPKFLSLEEIEHIMAMPDLATPIGKRDRALLELLYASGLRISELVGLTFSQLRLAEGFVVPLGKGKKERVVPFGKSAHHFLALYLEAARPALSKHARHDSVFISLKGTPLSRQGVW